MRKLRILFGAMIALVLSLVAVASASAYLHLANAQNYAAAHMWSSFCNNSTNYCTGYPWATGWYSRVNDSYVRVGVAVGTYTSGTCSRVFAVRGSDSSPYITSDGSSPYYTCG